ncbi:MAG: hypothetical protein HZA14_07695 [Nitrospirae bacterium]|nr:hypothetical protein [Nitrospirota bacterium]
MRRNYFLVNLLLVAVIGFLSVKLYKAVTYTMELPAVPAARQKMKEGGPEKQEAPALNEASFQVISTMDLFRPMRSPAPLITTPQQTASKIPPRLFGTVILNYERTALLEDPGTKTTRTYRVNDSVGGFTVTDIQEDRVVLTSDGEKVEVRLREEKKGLPTVRQPQMPVRPQPPMQPQTPPQVQSQTPPQRPNRPVPPQRQRPGVPAPSAPQHTPPPMPPEEGENMEELEPLEQ